MRIDVTGTNFANGTTVAQLSGVKGRQQGVDQATASDDGSHDYQRALGTKASDPSNVLAGNLVKAEHSPSKYVAAVVSNRQTERSFGDKAGALLGSFTAEFASLSSTHSEYVAAALIQHRVDEGLRHATDGEVTEQSASNLDDIKVAIEEQANMATPQQEAGPSDMTGSPVAFGTDDLAEPSDRGTMPTVNDTPLATDAKQPAAVPETPAAAYAAVAVGQPQVSSASVDIVV